MTSYLLLICDTIHNRMTSQQCDTNLYCTVVSHACIHAPLVRSQAKPKIVRSYRQHGNVTEYGKPLNPTLDLQVALFASSKNTRCAASDVNPFKIACCFRPMFCIILPVKRVYRTGSIESVCYVAMAIADEVLILAT